MSQLVVFESMVDLLRTKYKIGDILLEDPAFNALDIEFLRGRGFRVLETPQHAFEYAPPTTFASLPQAVIPVIQRTVQVFKPSLLLTNNLQNFLQSPDLRFRHMRPVPMPFLAQRVERALPHSEVGHWWGNNAIYYLPNRRARLAELMLTP